jgi:hypothetical protein
MRYYLNNWQNLNHSKDYGGDAFFDLWADGYENKRAKELLPGDTCLVLSRGEGNSVVIGTYTLDKVRPDRGTTNRFVRDEKLTRTDATTHPDYGRFFNRLGHVNQWSILRDA